MIDDGLCKDHKLIESRLRRVILGLSREMGGFDSWVNESIADLIEWTSDLREMREKETDGDNE